MALTSEQIRRLNAVAEASGLLDPTPLAPPAATTGQNKGALGDTATSLAIGGAKLPGIATGVADIGAGLYGGAVRSAAQLGGASEETIGRINSVFDRPFERATDWVGEKTGFQPGAWGDRLQERYSPQMQAAQAATQQATKENITDRWQEGDKWGAVRGLAPTTLEYLKNPRSIQALVGESLPMTFAGGLAGGMVARGAGMTTKMVGGKAVQVPRLGSAGGAGIGEGLVIAGAVMDEIDNDADYARAALASVFGGTFGALVGAGGAKVMQRAGLIDIDAAIAGRSLSAGVKEGTKPRSWPVRIAGGMVGEGLQEIPQESMEEIVQNWAEGKPLFDGVLEVVAPAFLAGAAMGGGVNILKPGQSRDLTGDTLGDPTQMQRKPTSPDSTGAEMLKQRTPAQLEDLYQNVAKLVANAPTDAEQVKLAAQMLTDIKAELESRGIGAAVLDLEAAQARYAQLQMQIPAVLRTYQKAVTEAPHKLPELQARLQKLREEFAAIHMKWGPSAESQTAVIGRYIRNEFGDTKLGEKAFRADGRLNRGMETQLERAKALTNEELALRRVKVGDAISTPRELAEAAMAQIRGEPVAQLIEQYQAAPPQLAAKQGKAKAVVKDRTPEQTAQDHIAQVDKLVSETVARNPAMAAAGVQRRIAVRQKYGMPVDDIQQLVTQGQPVNLAPAVTPTPAPAVTPAAQTPAAPPTDADAATVQQIVQRYSALTDRQRVEVARALGETSSAKTFEEVVRARPDEADAAVAEIRRRTTAVRTRYGQLREQQRQRVDALLGITDASDVAAAIAADPALADEAVAAAMGNRDMPKLEASQREVRALDALLRRQAMVTALDEVTRDPKIKTAVADFQTLLEVLRDKAGGRDIPNVKQEIARRTVKEGAKPRAEKTILGNLQTVMTRLYEKLEADPSTLPQLKTIMDTYLADTASELGYLDEATLSTDRSQLAEDMVEAQTDTEMGEDTERPVGDTDLASGVAPADVVAGDLTIRDSMGQARVGIAKNPEQLRKARQALKGLETQIQKTTARYNAAVNDPAQRANAADIQETLRQQMETQAELEEQVAEMAALFENEADSAEVKAAQQVEDEALNAWKNKQSTITATLAAVADLDSSTGQETGALWDANKLDDAPSWAELLGRNVIAAWTFMGELQKIMARRNAMAEDRANAVYQAYKAAVKAYNTDPQSVSLGSARQLADQIVSTRGRYNVATEGTLRQAQSPRTARAGQGQDTGQRPAKGRANRRAAPEAATPAGEEVTPDAQTVRENQGRPAQSGGAPTESQADRGGNVQQDAQAQREAGNAQEQVIRVAERQYIGTEKGNPFKVRSRAVAKQAEVRAASPPVATEIVEVDGGFKLRPLPIPAPQDLVPYFNEVRALLDSITRPKLRNEWTKEFRKHEQLLPAEQLANYPAFITRLQDAIRSDAGQQAAAAKRAQAAQAPAAPEAGPGVTAETNAQLDETAELNALSIQAYGLTSLADSLLDVGDIVETQELKDARRALDDVLLDDAAGVPTISAAYEAFQRAINVAQAGPSQPQAGVLSVPMPARRMTVEEVYEAIEDDFRDAPGARNIIKVYEDAATLPASVQRTIAEQAKEGNKTRAVYDPETGHIYLNARTMRTNRGVRSIVMHELGVHFSLSGRTPNRMEQLAYQIYAWYDSAVAKEASLWTEEETLAVSTVRSVGVAARARPQPLDEIVAYFVDIAVQAGIDPTQLATIKSPALKGWFKKFVEAVSELGQRISAMISGESPVKLTAQDIVDLAYGLAQIEISVAARTGKPSPYGVRPDGVQSGIDTLTQRLPQPAQWWWTDLKGRLMKAAGVTMFSRDMVDWAGKHGLTTAKAYFESLTSKLALRDEKLIRLQKVVAPTAKWDYEVRNKFNEFLRLSAYREEWGFEPTWLAKHNYDPSSLSAVAFQKLLQQAKTPQQRQEIQTVAHNMFHHANQIHTELQAHIRKEIESSYIRLIADAKTPAQRKQQEAARDNALREHDTKQHGFRNAYLPLRRWGDWAVVWKSPELIKAEAAGDRTRVRQLKGEFAHYAVLFETSEQAALRMREELQANLRNPKIGNVPDAVVAEPYPRMQQREMLNEEIPFDMINKLKQMVDLGPDVSRGTRDSVMNALDRMYIAALAETSSRKSELERLSVMGANKDMIRGFIEQGTGMAALSAALDTNANTRELIGKMKNEAMASGPQRKQRMLALNELLARHAQAMTYEEHPVLSQVMGATSVWMLMSNPAYYIQNSTQTFMLGYPMLAGEFGGAKAMARMVQNYPQILKLHRATKTGELLDPSKITDPSKQQLFRDLQMRGLLDVGIAMDLGTFKDAHSKVGRMVSAVHQKMVNAVRTVELYNRGVTAMSAYELKLDQLTKDPQGRSMEEMQATAREFALDTVAVTQGDYSGVNAPRLISMIPAGRLVTQFRKFQLIQIGLLTRTLYNAFKDAKTPQQRAERLIARKQFGYLMMMHGTMGGMLGLPIPMVMWWAVAKAFGDEDEPANIELLARREIGNKEVADLLLRGLPAYAGINMSERLGMGMTFSLLPFTDIKPTRDGTLVAMATALGPWTTALARGVDGIGQIQQGNALAGTAQMMPAGIMNLIRAYENHTAGVRNRRGDLLMTPDELGYLELVTQGIGWPSKKLSDRHLIRGFQFEAEEHFKGRATKIRRVYADAWQSGDNATMQRAIDEWLRLQEMKLNYRLGSFLPVSDLTKAPLDRMKREQQTLGGVQYKSTGQGFLEDMFM